MRPRVRIVRPRPKGPRRPAVPSQHEARLAIHIRAFKLPEPVREFMFAAPERKWRFDFAWPDGKVAAEVEGGTKYGQSRHSRGAGFDLDAEKYNEAAIRGWLVLRFSDRMVLSGEAVRVIQRALIGRDLHNVGLVAEARVLTSLVDQLRREAESGAGDD
jgi:very-short-patch-repair endonuclease